MEHPTPLTLALRQWLENPDSTLPPHVAEQLQRHYPYFPMAEVAALRQEASGLPEAARRELVERLVLSVADPAAAQRLVDPAAGARFDNFYPPAEAPETPDTDKAISRFLENYGAEGSTSDAEVAVLEKLIFNPVADYSQQLAREEAESIPSARPTGNDHTDRINRFILAQKGETGAEPEPPADPDSLPEADPTGRTAIQPNPPAARPAKKAAPVQTPPENALLSESLAKIYIKTGRYERAYEILKRLSLAVPEKNAYFADQLRFLRKLIVADRLRRAAASND